MRQVAQVMEFVWMSSVTVHRDGRELYRICLGDNSDGHVQNLTCICGTEDLKEIHAPRHLERLSSASTNAVEKDDVMWLRVFARDVGFGNLDCSKRNLSD